MKFKSKNAAETTNAFSLVDELWQSMVNGCAPWQQSWDAGRAPGHPTNHTTGKGYRAGNALWLMSTASRNGWSNHWISFLEASKLGGSLKGQKSSKIEVPFIKTEVDKDSGDEVETLKGFRTCSVFNIDQVEGVEFDRTGVTQFIRPSHEIDLMLLNLKSKGLNYVENDEQDGCYYDPVIDTIFMPPRHTFQDTYAFYSALVHEMAHATGRPGRVERPQVSYAYEEVRAEIASTLICNSLGLPRGLNHIGNHASFLNDYMEEFGEKKTMLLKAASEAQSIHDYLMDAMEVKVAA